MENNTITVTGMATIFLQPDTIKFYISLQGRDLSYDEASTLVEENYIKLKESLKENGINEQLLTTSQINIYSEGRANENCTSFHQNLNIELHYEPVVAQKIIESITQSGTGATFQVSFDHVDSEAYEKELFSLAMKDATRKATVLSEIANKAIEDILNVIQGNVILHPLAERMSFTSEALQSTGIITEVIPEKIRRSEEIQVTFKMK